MIAMAEGVRFTVSPANPTSNGSWLVYSIKPGDTIKDEVLVKNLSEKALTLSAYAVDQEKTAKKEDFALAAESAPRTNVGKWAMLDKDSVTVAPNSEVKVGLTFTVPAGTADGKYAGGVIVEAMPAKASGSGASASIGARVGLRLYADVFKDAVTTDPMAIKAAKMKAAEEKAAAAAAEEKATQPATANQAANSSLLTPMNIGIAVVLLLVIAVLVKSMSSKSKKK